jgi:hypothetical protein
MQLTMVSFQQLRDAVEFLADHLENRKYETIANQCTDSLQDTERVREALPTPRSYRLTAIKALGERHAQCSLRRLYEAREFPRDTQEFKLGGHGKELGHIHVDFQMTAAGWYLKEVSICR